MPQSIEEGTLVRFPWGGETLLGTFSHYQDKPILNYTNRGVQYVGRRWVAYVRVSGDPPTTYKVPTRDISPVSPEK